MYVMAVRDKKVGAYMNPFFSQSQGAALRSFQDEVNRAAEDNILYRHPQDFDLYLLGTFDNESGSWETLLQPELLLAGDAALLRKEDSQPRLRGIN